jgi:peptide/nickel transport system permease protein
MKHKHQQLKTPHDNAYKSDIRQRSLSLHRPGIVWERFTRNKVAVVALLTIAALGIAAILAPALTHQSRTADPANDTHIEIALQGPSLAHPLGTDELGRDEFARVLYGARVSLVVGLASMLVSIVIGVLVGAVSGYFGKWVDDILMRITDTLIAIPIILIMFVVSASLSNYNIGSSILLIGLLSWPNTARIVRGECLAIKEREFVHAAKTIGASSWQRLLWHILPNIIDSIIVNASLLIGNNIVTESLLSFFGFGVRVPQASWGTMLSSAQDYYSSDQLLVLVPALAIFIAVLCFNLVGDALRDALSPYYTGQ